MKKAIVNSKKRMYLRLCVMLFVPFILSILLFNPLEKFEMQCSKNTCQETESQDGSTIISKAMQLEKTKIETHFLGNFLDKFFKTSLNYNTYNLIVQDLSEIENLELLSLNLITSFREETYTINYKGRLKIKNVKLQPGDNVSVTYLLDIPSSAFLLKDPKTGFKIDYVIIITKPFNEFFVKFLFILIGWAAFYRLLRKTAYYICYEDRD